jgi:hypothetical protein
LQWDHQVCSTNLQIGKLRVLRRSSVEEMAKPSGMYQYLNLVSNSGSSSSFSSIIHDTFRASAVFLRRQMTY